MHTLREYLLQSGVLATKDAAQIAAAKDRYWKEYKRAWIRAKRQKEMSVSLLFTKQELKIIDAGVRDYTLTRTQMVKQAALAFLTGGYIVPNKEMIGKIQELLTLTYTALQELQEEGCLPQERGTKALQKMEDLERRILKHLQNPVP